MLILWVALIWVLVSIVVSIFVGAMISGRSPFRPRVDGASTGNAAGPEKKRGVGDRRHRRAG